MTFTTTPAAPHRHPAEEDETVATVTIHRVRASTAPGYPPCFEYYVYRGAELIRVCPSEGMAREVAAGAA